MDKDELIVSVCMITYNHESYISDSIKGVLMQQTSFAFELIIGEDYSSDGTRKICQELQSKYPEKIRLLLPEKNIGMLANLVNTLKACSGKYIAMCEGDDYWTDPRKLQKQIDFLEANNEYSICFHEVKILQNEELLVDEITRNVPDETDILDLAKGNYIHTPSVIFRRNDAVFYKLNKINSTKIGDYVLHMLNAQYGKIKKINEPMAIYRVHAGGIHSSKLQTQKNEEWLTLLRLLLPYFEGEVKRILINSYTTYAIQVLTQNKLSIQKEKEILHNLNELNPNLIIQLINENEYLKQTILTLNLHKNSKKNALKVLLKPIIRSF